MTDKQEEVKKILDEYYSDIITRDFAFEEICQLFQDYVKLAKDQTLPPNEENDFMNTSPRRVCSDTQEQMVKAGWRKVELEPKPVCPECKGTGSVDKHGRAYYCPSCGGTGIKPEEK